MEEALNLDLLVAEFELVDFADARLKKRLDTIVRGIGRAPTRSLPKVFESAELEGAYRFFSNPVVTMQTILAPHLLATKQRVHASPQRVRILHDQTEFCYRRGGARRGLTDRAYQGFSGHFSLVVAADESRRPLGLAGLHTWVRGEAKETEHSYWLKQIAASESLLECGAKAVHVADRGAADYALFHELIAADHRFVIRVSDRYTESGPPEETRARLSKVFAVVEHSDERKATINARSNRRHNDPNMRRIYPARERRSITLHVAATRVVIANPQSKRCKVAGGQLEVNVVRVWEPEPPEGEKPIEWFLFTNEPIDTPADACAVVDHYRARWVIEEYFKALKTGCAFESRQLQDYEGLVNALAVFAPIAYHVLLLRTHARYQPDAPASSVIDEDHIAVLRVLGRRELPPLPTARDVLLAIAALGGHIKYAPDPGWLTISRGFETLELLTQGWRAAKLQPSCDQR